MDWPPIRKPPNSLAVTPNLADYETVYTGFTWDSVRRALDGLPNGGGFNIAHEADEGWRSGSISAEISARIMEKAFYDLDAPVERICGVEGPAPYPKHLEQAAQPQAEMIANTAQRMVSRRG